MKDAPPLLSRIWRTGAAFVSLVTLYVIGQHFGPLPALVEHLLLFLTVITAVHLIERAWTWKETAEWSRRSLEQALRDHDALQAAAASSGILSIYPNRRLAEDDVMTAIRKAQRIVWILGVELSEVIRLDSQLLDLLKQKIDDKVDVRLLLLDALRSPAIFRTFLESRPDEVQHILAAHAKGPPMDDPLFHQRLYIDFMSAYNTLRLEPAVGERARFYAHAPTCWMVVADEAAYFEAYTFGRGKEMGRNLTIGPLMPVIRFRPRPRGGPFDILKNHFERLWTTSDTDILRMGAYVTDRETIAHAMFTHRKDWLTHVARTLCRTPEAERRKYLRHRCESSPPSLVAHWNTGNRRDAKIVDYSQKGLGVKVSAPLPELGSTVGLEWSEEGQRGAVFVLQELERTEKGSFVVKHVDQQKGVVGLAAC